MEAIDYRTSRTSRASRTLILLTLAWDSLARAYCLSGHEDACYCPSCTRAIVRALPEGTMPEPRALYSPLGDREPTYCSRCRTYVFGGVWPSEEEEETIILDGTGASAFYGINGEDV